MLNISMPNLLDFSNRFYIKQYLIETFGETNQKKERVFKIQQEASAVFEAAKPKETTPRRKLFASRPPSFLTFGVVCNDALQNDGSRSSSPATSLPDSN